MSSIFVNDVRSSDDPSMELVPRIYTFSELKSIFGLDIDTSQGAQRTSVGKRYWALVGFEVRSGIASYLTQVKLISDKPAENILVFRHWPDAPELPTDIDPKYFSNADAGFTDSNGIKGDAYGGGSVTGANGGPDYIWVSSDPIQAGNRSGSDMACKLGWIGGTNHLTANPIFLDSLKEDDNSILPADNSIRLSIGGDVVYQGKFRVIVE